MSYGASRTRWPTGEQLYKNFYTVAGYTEEEIDTVKNPKYKDPADVDLPPVDLCDAYLRDTPFVEFLMRTIPFSIPERIRFEHTHIVAGTGHGKTQFLQSLILGDLQQPDPPALIIIDSQGEMLEKIQKLSLFAQPPLSERIVIVNPEDERPPALNMFAQASN
jgi:hypothetical protein